LVYHRVIIPKLIVFEDVEAVEGGDAGQDVLTHILAERDRGQAGLDSRRCVIYISAEV
jgi:hypothetical protein